MKFTTNHLKNHPVNPWGTRTNFDNLSRVEKDSKDCKGVSIVPITKRGEWDHSLIHVRSNIRQRIK